MKIALLTVDLHGAAIAYKLQSEGHEVWVGQVKDWSSVQMQIKENEKDKRKRLQLYDGLFENKWPIDKLVSFMLGQPRGTREDWFVLCDFNWMWPYADKLRKAGYRGLLPHREDYMLEHDRSKMRELVEELYPEVDTGDYHEFKTAKDGIAFLQENDETLYVLKGFNAEAETLVPDQVDVNINRQVLLDALEHDKDRYYEKDGFILEEYVPDAIEFTPEAYAFDGEMRTVSVDIEHKRIGSRNGPMTGCAADTVLWQKLDCPLWDKFLEPLASRMLRKNELTIWDLSILYSPEREKYYAGEFCSNRMGFDATFTEICTYRSATDWLENLIYGASLPASAPDPVGVSVRLFNLDKQEKIWIGEPADRNVWCFDIHLADGQLYASGLDKNTYVVTESAEDIHTAIDELYELETGIEFAPGYCLQKNDWYDKEWSGNILHRLEVLEDLKLIKGGESDARENGEKIEIIGTTRTA